MEPLKWWNKEGAEPWLSPFLYAHGHEGTSVHTFYRSNRCTREQCAAVRRCAAVCSMGFCGLRVWYKVTFKTAGKLVSMIFSRSPSEECDDSHAILWGESLKNTIHMGVAPWGRPRLISTWSALTFGKKKQSARRPALSATKGSN